MVAYSFKKQFAAPILDGTKIGTIRNDRKRHARPGEELQLYTGMRTRQCRLVARKICKSVHRIRMGIDAFRILYIRIDDKDLPDIQWDDFAVGDGFADISAMGVFWMKDHGQGVFTGVWIRWA